MYELNEEITLIVTRQEPNFDRACESASYQAIVAFGVDEDGHINSVKDSKGSRDSIEIKFIGYDLSISIGSWHHTYEFTAKVISNE